MTRVCLVKQNITYDLYTRTGPDLPAIVASSNWRSGPVGLWEAFDTSVRIVYEDPSRECQIGKRHWSQYVQGWDLWPDDAIADHADDVDWGAYDVVISIDVALPTRIIRRFSSVMWCYYFIEGGPTAIDGPLMGSPFYGYNVFLNHRLAKEKLSPSSHDCRQMRSTRRAVLDFPYYMQSSHSIRDLYPDLAGSARDGFCISHHSRAVLSADELAALAEIGSVRTEWTTITDIHRAEMLSTYFLVHPASRPSAGLALIEAASAGCLVLAPSHCLWGFPELITPDLDFSTMPQLMEIVRRLEADPPARGQYLLEQERRVDEWCYRNPAANLETMLGAFRASSSSTSSQRRAEIQARILTKARLATRRLARRGKRLADSAPRRGRT